MRSQKPVSARFSSKQIYVAFCVGLPLLGKMALMVLSAAGVNSFSAGIDFKRQNLTSVDVRF